MIKRETQTEVMRTFAKMQDLNSKVRDIEEELIDSEIKNKQRFCIAQSLEGRLDQLTE